MAKKIYYIAWNEGFNEGFATDDPYDAYTAQTGLKHPMSRTIGSSTAALAFHEAYEDETIKIQEILI